MLNNAGYKTTTLKIVGSYCNISLTCSTAKLRGVCGQVGRSRWRAALITPEPQPTRRDCGPAEKPESPVQGPEPTFVQQQPHPELTGVSQIRCFFCPQLDDKTTF